MTKYSKIVCLSVLLSVTMTDCQQKEKSHIKEKSYILIDHRTILRVNPFKNQLDSLYQQPDSMEILFLPQIINPRLFTLNSNQNDTLFLSQTDQEGNFKTQKLWDYFGETDSTLYSGLLSARFSVSINWDGEVIFVEAKDIKGSFDKEKWQNVWNRIQSIPSKQDGIVNDFRFSQQLTVK